METKHILHPEVEQEIRSNARKYLAAQLEKGDEIWGDRYVSAAEAGVISFDDIYFLGINVAAENVSLENFVDVGEAPIREGIIMGQKYSGIDEDNPKFQKKITERARYLTGLLYGITVAQVLERFHNIQNKSGEFINRRLK